MAQAKAPPTNINQMLIQYQSEIARALPKHLTPDRMARIALTAIRNNYRLQQADPLSLMGAIIRASQDGLEPGRTAHLVPFKNGKLSKQAGRDVYDVQYIADYRGLIELARRSGQIGRFSAEVVREGDFFEYEMGLDEYLRHKPGHDASRPVIAVYAVARAKDNSWGQFHVMTTAEVEKIRARSRAAKEGPWVTDWEAMAKKTVARQLCKWLPQSTELFNAVLADEAAERGEQRNRDIIEGALTDAPAPAEKGAAGLKQRLQQHQPDEAQQGSDDESPGVTVAEESYDTVIDAAESPEQLEQIKVGVLSDQGLTEGERSRLVDVIVERLERLALQDVPQ